jgi:hypothetical protein
MGTAIAIKNERAAVWWSALAATALGLMTVWSLPLIALGTGAYYMPATLSNVALLLVYLSPVALPVVMPPGIALGVLAVCRRPSDARRVRFAVVLLVIVGTVVATVLFVWIAPLASQAYRDLAAPRGIDMRVNAPGSAGYQLLRDEGWAILCANGVLAAFGIIAAGVARGRPEIRLAAGLATMPWPFLYLPFGALATQRLLPILLAAWLPNLIFAPATVLLLCLQIARTRVAISQ